MLNNANNEFECKKNTNFVANFRRDIKSGKIWLLATTEKNAKTAQ